MTDQEIEQKVIKIVAEHLGAEAGTITPETRFEELNADSLDFIEMTMEFEDEFDTTIPDEQAEKMKTVGDAIAFIKQACRGETASGTGAKVSESSRTSTRAGVRGSADVC